ncbi:uncharacterized protein LOC107646455 [Arachis ipaensis]|uniref:uncharacterized protein LOC107646455 n=1 Tax=Arachis ipaensis TaxID=130454 RepID=UPI0007AF51CA|nr:uncharacterized protein LOC107646455 [Arachis ipaensis]XP_025661194.1 uncharacterized protein LOC112756790 [Arachis hypogaea]
MVITTRVGTGIVKQILVDTEADSNIMFCNVFDALGLRDADLRGNQHGVVGLGDNFIKPDGVVSLPISIGGGQGKRSLMAEFVVLRDSTTYNLILGRKTINEFGVVICTKLLLMKFVADDGSIPMHRPDEEKTEFIMPGGTYCYKVMPFGLKNAGATYQRLMNKILKDLIGKTVEVYVDDILVKTTEAEDLISDLENVFASLRRHDMRLNSLKCAFANGS